MDTLESILAPFAPSAAQAATPDQGSAPVAQAPPPTPAPTPETQAGLASVLAPFAPAQPPKPEPENNTGDGPSDLGAWDVASGALWKGLRESVQGVGEFGSAVASKAQGGSFFQASGAPQEHQDEIDKILQAHYFDNWLNPKWYLAAAAHGVGSMGPAIGLGLAGGMAGEAVPLPGAALVGSATGFAAGQTIATIIPNFRNAKAQGLDDDAAIEQALKTTGVGAAFAAMQGLAPGFSVFGKGADGVLVAPIKEMLTQLGVIQPTLGTAGTAAELAVQGRDITPDALAGSFVTNAIVGVPLSVPHILANKAKAAIAPEKPTPPPIEVRDVAPGTEEPLVDVKTKADELAVTPSPVFYSAVTDHIERKGPESASGTQWLATLRNAPGVKSEELDHLQLEPYLVGQDGKVSKKDLLAHIEQNQIVLDEVQESRINRLGPKTWDEVEGSARYEEYKAPGPYSAYGIFRFIWDTPQTREGRKLRDQIFAREDALDAEYGSYDAIPPDVRNAHNRWVAGLDRRLAELTRADTKPKFLGAHWKEPNTMGHFRWTARIDREGKNTLHIEELQDDWAQEGRKHGFGPPDTSKWSVERTEDNTIVRNEQGRELVRFMGAGFTRDVAVNAALHHLMADRVLGVPDRPFKSSWTDLVIKRILRFAADNGYERISWNNGELSKYPAGGKTNPGLMKFYDEVVPNKFGALAKKLGMGKGGETSFPEMEISTHKWVDTAGRPLSAIEALRDPNAVPVKLQGLVRYIDVPPAAASRIRMGLPLFKEASGLKIVPPKPEQPEPPNLRPALMLMKKAFERMSHSLQIDRAIRIELLPEVVVGGRRAFGSMGVHAGDGSYVIRLSMKNHPTAEDLYATLAHEFGHVVKHNVFEKAPHEVQQAIIDEYNRWMHDTLVKPDASSSTGKRGATFEELIKARDNAISLYNDHLQLTDSANAKVSILSLTPERQQYWAGFEEYFAEQVARWATTSEKPLSMVDRFYWSLGRKIRDLVVGLREKMGLSAEPGKVMGEWLDRKMIEGPYAADIIAQMQMETMRINQLAFDQSGHPDVEATPLTGSSGGGRGIIRKLFGGSPPEGAGVAGASADKMNRFYEWMISLPQLARINGHIRPLQYYNEVAALMHMKYITGSNDSLTRMHEWKRAGKQRNAVTNLILDIMERRHLTPEELAKKVRRLPTDAELAALGRKHGIDTNGINLFHKIRGDFERFLDRAAQMWKMEANRIQNPLDAAAKIADIDARVAELKKEMYFPFMRFGRYTLTIRDKSDGIVRFERYESQRKRDAAMRIFQREGESDHYAQAGKLDEDTLPLNGLPSMLLDKLPEKLELSASQRRALELLRFEYSPQNSFRHRFERRDRVAGYSQELMRAYANYFFHGWRYLVRAEHADQLRAFVRQTRFSAGRAADVTKRQEIANYMGQHLKYMLDPKDDWHALKGLAFHWFLGFSPAAATLNLSQTMMGTYPWLASKFGDVAAIKHMTRASTQLSTFYKKATIQGMTERDARAISEGIREGRITEALAPELAANSEGRNLGFGVGGNATQRMWSGFSEASGKMFELTEQTNRRVAFRAAWNAALENPGARYLQDLQKRMPLLYNRLLDRGWTPTESRALLAAMDVVDSTQFLYASYARPKFMWGRKGTVFVFKSFTQNTLFSMMNNPSAAMRSLLIMGALGGAMGLPGAEDISGLLKGLAYRLFGKDFDVQDQARQFVVDHLGGAIPPDGLLHGLSRYGYGIPQVLDMLGSLVGASKLPVPMFDRHGALGMGNILPVEPGKLLGPSKDTSGPIADSTQRASGAVFGLGFALYKFLTAENSSFADMKRWEGVMPRAMKNASQAFRYYKEEMERNSRGAAVVRFDPYEPQQMFEILGKAAGYQPTRLQQKWDLIMAQREAETYWDLRKQGLLRQAWAAKKSADEDGFKGVLEAVRKFNEDLPTQAKGMSITGETLRKSFLQRAKIDESQESGVPLQKGKQGLAQSVQRLFPEAQIDVRKVK